MASLTRSRDGAGPTIFWTRRSPESDRNATDGARDGDGWNRAGRHPTGRLQRRHCTESSSSFLSISSPLARGILPFYDAARRSCGSARPSRHPMLAATRFVCPSGDDRICPFPDESSRLCGKAVDEEEPSRFPNSRATHRGLMTEGGKAGGDEERDVCRNRALRREEGRMFVGAGGSLSSRFRMFVAAKSHEGTVVI